MYAKAYDFVISIAEPVNRAHFIHEYKISTYSLYAAVSLGLDTDSIITALNRLSKVPVDIEVEDFIRQNTESYGKVKLVLKEDKYYLEATDSSELKRMMGDEELSSCFAGSTFDVTIDKTTPKFKRDDREGAQAEAGDEDEDGDDPWGNGEEGDGNVSRIQVHGHRVRDVKKRCSMLHLPVLEEYDFRNDSKNPSLNIQLRPTVCVRAYQAKSLSKMFGGGRARSGIIVLPCGAGKTLVGISAATTVNKQILVVTSSSVAVEQWRCEFLKFTTIKPEAITCFQAEGGGSERVTDKTQVLTLHD
jgi:DNA excision repair protein ERCC-3